MKSRVEWIKGRLEQIRRDIESLQKEQTALIRENLKLGVESMRIDATHVNIVYVDNGQVTSVLSNSPIDEAIKELHMRANYIDSVHSNVWFEGKQMVFKTGDCKMFLEEYKP